MSREINFKRYKHLEFDRYHPPTRYPIKKRPGYGKPPKEQDVKNHGEKLAKELDEVEKEQERVRKRIYPPDLNPQLIFIIDQEVENDELLEVDETSLTNSGIEILEKEGENWIIVFATEGHVAQFKKKLHTYKKEIKKMGKKALVRPRFSGLFNNVKEILPRFPKHRLGKTLKAYYEKEEFPEEFIRVRIDFWWLGKPIIEKRMDLCEEILKKSKCEVISRYSDYGIASIITKINLEALKSIMELTEVYKIEVIEIKPIERKISTINIKEFPEINITEVSSKPIICLIDTGVTENHPILHGTVINSFLKTENSDLTNDENGHGTHLTGTLLYGDLGDKIQEKEIFPQARLISVKIAKEFQMKNISDMNNKITESIRDVYENYGCKLFILTYLPSYNPFSSDIKTREHQLSRMLDSIINELNIVIVAPIGNYRFEDVDLDKLQQSDLDNGKYAQFLFSNKVFEGASGNSVLTIGAIAGKDTYPSSHSSIPIASIKVISKKKDPSLLTRTGPGLGDCIKPDLNAVGGNWVYYPDVAASFTTLEDLAFFGPKYDALTSNLLEYDIGTCISACYTGHLLSRLMELYPGHTGNFYRALLSNRSSPNNPSDTFLRNNDINDSKLKKQYLNLFGFGSATNKKLYHGFPNSITVYHEGEIPLDEVHCFNLPIPDSFKNRNEDRGVIVTLAYNPPVSATRKEYRGVELSFRYVYKKTKAKDIYDYFSETEDEEEIEKIYGESRYNFEVDYSSVVRSKSTLKTARYKWDRFPKGTRKTTYKKMEEYSHFIVVQCKKKSWFNADAANISKQPYCLVVTIWHKDSNEIYEQVQQKIREEIRLRA
ncbi:MAG: S8 family serine peptidase [Promethearchaeota archaeon]